MSLSANYNKKTKKKKYIPPKKKKLLLRELDRANGKYRLLLVSHFAQICVQLCSQKYTVECVIKNKKLSIYIL